jgi:hypothetical protein
MTTTHRKLPASIILLSVLLCGGPEWSGQCPSPAAAEPAPREDGSSPGNASAAPARDHQSALDGIADLLIDDEPARAKAAAEALLTREELPPHVTDRAQQLLAKAEARLPPPPPPPPPLPPFPAASFDVRVARIGSGFGAGESGSLRLDATGISFVPAGSREIAWGVVWDRVEGLARDEGLWDTRHPLVLRRRGESPRYLAVTDDSGGFPAPDRLLSAFERARRAARQRRTAETRGGTAEPPGKEQP